MHTDIRTLLLSALACLPGGCSTWNCNPDSEPFSLEAEVITEGDVRELLLHGGYTDRSDISCETFCALQYTQQTGWESSIDTCAFSLSEDAGEDEDDPVGEVTCAGTGFEFFCEGRRPLGHIEPSLASPSTDMGAYLARCAHLEAASVFAFQQLARQLQGWGAPPQLVARCLQAAAEEARHALTVETLALTQGAPPVQPPRAVPAAEDRLAVALHNAVEGCVSEAWAALVAHWKADHAEDAEIRAAYRGIAVEEVAHAQLAWDLHDWLVASLTSAERQQVEAARQAALAALPARACALLARMPAALGVPAPDAVHRTAHAFSDALWSAAQRAA